MNTENRPLKILLCVFCVSAVAIMAALLSFTRGFNDARRDEDLTAPREKADQVASSTHSPAQSSTKDLARPTGIELTKKAEPKKEGWLAPDEAYSETHGTFGTKAELLGKMQSVRTSPVSRNRTIDAAAQAKADDEVKRGYFSHVDPDGRDFTYWLDKAGYEFSYGGENLSKGYATVSDAFDAFMNSPTHRDNILSVNYSQVGIGIAADAQGHYYIVVMFAFPA